MAFVYHLIERIELILLAIRQSLDLFGSHRRFAHCDEVD